MKIGRVIVSVLLVSCIIIFGCLYVRYKSLPEYAFGGNAMYIERSNVVYKPDEELFKKFQSGELKPIINYGHYKIIGRLKGDKFIGYKTWVVKLDGIDEKEGFMINGLMFSGFYSRVWE